MMSLNSKSSFLSPFGLTLCILSILGTAYSLDSKNKGKQYIEEECITTHNCRSYAPTCADFKDPSRPGVFFCVDCTHPYIIQKNLDDCKPNTNRSKNAFWIFIAVFFVGLLLAGGAAAAFCYLLPGLPLYEMKRKRDAQQKIQAQPNSAAAPLETNNDGANNDVAVNNAVP